MKLPFQSTRYFMPRYLDLSSYNKRKLRFETDLPKDFFSTLDLLRKNLMKLNLHKDEQLDLLERTRSDRLFSSQASSLSRLLNFQPLLILEIEADGIYINSSNFPHFSIAIQTADCLPTFFLRGSFLFNPCWLERSSVRHYFGSN